jgi:EmrB/QacA subfamily drug resistance transporter
VPDLPFQGEMFIAFENVARYQRLVLFVTTLGAFMTPLDASIVSVALPSISNTFRMGYAGVIWIPVAYLLCLATLLLTFGKLSDVKGRKLFFTSGFALFTVASALCGISQNGGELIFFRGLQGVSAAMIGATSAAIVTDVFPPEKRGKALGINVLAVYTGLAVGPTLGGALVQAFGWRSIFYINVPIGIIVSLIAATRLQESAEHKTHKRHFDLLGAALFTSGLSLVLLGLTLTGSTPWIDPVVIGPLLGGGCLIFLFLGVELRRGEQALLDLDLFRKNRLFAAANFSALLNYTAYFAVPYFLSFYLQTLRSMSPLVTGLTLMAMPVPMAILSPISGWLSDKIGSRLLASTGMGLICVALLFLTQLALSTPLPYLTAVLFLLGVGMGMFSAPNTSSVMGSVDRRHLGIASGTISTMRFVGQSLSLAIMGAVAATIIPPQVFSAIFGGVGSAGSVSADAFLKGASFAFLTGAAIAFVGVITSTVRGSKKKE